MPKAHRNKRKVPVTAADQHGRAKAGSAGTSSSPAATRTVIRRFHVLNKRQTQLQRLLEGDDRELSPQARNAREELTAIEQEISDMGGLESYQKMSVIGQGDDRGGGSEKVLLEFLDELGIPGSLEKQPWQ